mmetsp:Transcript_19674/g.43781  ORF Transcript_19674/g.43781 Transcript_19674/m.43781 type:complete len:583 (-) Transcript_19674:38-1786(-)
MLVPSTTVAAALRRLSIQRRHLNRRPLFPRFTSSSSSAAKEHYDVLIVGGGAVGSSMANALRHAGAVSSIGVLEFRGAPPPLSAYIDDSENKQNKGNPNARAYALSPASLELINNGSSFCNPRSSTASSSAASHDVSPAAGPIARLDEMGRVARYDSMQIWESDGPATLHFSNDDLSTESIDPYKAMDTSSADGAGYQDVLGAVIEDGPLVSALWNEMQNSNDDGVDFICNAAIKSIVAPSPNHASRGLAPPKPVELTYQVHNAVPEADSKGHPLTKTITADLLVAADGGNSTVRRMLGMPTVGFGYGRRAVTCTVKVDGSMGRTAYQRFMPNGPMALLPVWSEGDDIYANIVWSTTPSVASDLQQLSEEDFVRELNDCMQSGPVNTQSLFPSDLVDSILPGPLAGIAKVVDYLARGANDGLTMSRWSESRPFGLPPTMSSVVGPRLAFDLSLSQARSYVAPRVALVGDAAHTVHPMAGQGLNLGIGDVDCLVRHIRSAMSSGMDPGGTMHFLNQYDSERRAEVSATLGGIHALHNMFGTTFSPAVYIRSLGMNLVNAAGPVRRRLAEVAAGRRGALPGLSK